MKNSKIRPTDGLQHNISVPVRNWEVTMFLIIFRGIGRYIVIQSMNQCSVGILPSK